MVWGGDAGCGHEWGDEFIAKQSGGGLAKGGNQTGGDKNFQLGERSQGQFCRHCGAWRGSYGLEPTIELYVEHTVEIFREVRRVLRGDGVCFINLGDSYSSQGGPLKDGGGINDILGGKSETQDYNRSRKAPTGLKPKDLCGIPWRVALALQADGWYLRSDIIWAKPNPMPESCRDRPTTAHEHIFLLTKSGRYYWDQESVREGCVEGPPAGNKAAMNKGRLGKEGWSFNPENSKPANGRNLRSVWSIATAPFPQAHFATFPPAIPERCIKAGTSEKGCCPKCGAPWVRVVEKERPEGYWRIPGTHGKRDFDGNGMRMKDKFNTKSTTTGWVSTCTCREGYWEKEHGVFRENQPYDPIPCTVLDPFSGAGTTALVAAKLGRDAIGIELNPEYVEMSRKRIVGEMGMLVEMTD